MPEKNDTTLSYRVTQLEKDQEQIASNVYKIMTNHLPHLSNDISVLRGDIKSVSSEVRAYAIINAAAIVIGLVVSRFIS